MSTQATQGAPGGPRWAAWHLHLSTLGAPATDQVVRHVVGPAVDALREWETVRQRETLRQRDTKSAWFFVRYWQFGPHVRLRIADLGPDLRHQVDSLLRARLSEVRDTAGLPLTEEVYRNHAAPLAAAGEGGGSLEVGELWPPGVYRQPYQPEAERYGGAALLPQSESLFHQASELALAFIRLNPPEAARSGLGLRATQAALESLGRDDRRRFCQRAAARWQAWAEQGGAGNIPMPLPPGRLEGPAPAPVRRWAGRLSQAMTLWRAATSDEKAEQILHSHVHMLHNRLGLSVAQERNHYLALADLLAPAPAQAVAR